MLETIHHPLEQAESYAIQNAPIDVAPLSPLSYLPTLSTFDYLFFVINIMESGSLIEALKQQKLHASFEGKLCLIHT